MDPRKIIVNYQSIEFIDYNEGYDYVSCAFEYSLTQTVPKRVEYRIRKILRLILEEDELSYLFLDYADPSNVHAYSKHLVIVEYRSKLLDELTRTTKQRANLRLQKVKQVLYESRKSLPMDLVNYITSFL